MDKSMGWGVLIFSMTAGATALAEATGDFDGNGYVDSRDFRYLEACLSLSGPGVPSPFTECRTVFDADGDGDIDLYLTNSEMGTPNALYRNKGDGTFESITREAGVDYGQWAWGGEMIDYDSNQNKFALAEASVPLAPTATTMRGSGVAS